MPLLIAVVVRHKKVKYLMSLVFIKFMTDILVDILNKEYRGVCGSGCVSVYGVYERIYLNLTNEKFSKAPSFNDSKKILRIAKEIFDVPFDFEMKGDIGEAIFFSPKINDAYHQNHFGHYIQVHLPSAYPMITISTGNRDAVKLFETQRNNYFEFVKGLYSMFINHAGH